MIALDDLEPQDKASQYNLLLYLAQYMCSQILFYPFFEPFVPIADNKAFKRLAFAISRFEVEGVEGVEGVLTCRVVGLWGCMVARLNVTHTNAAF